MPPLEAARRYGDEGRHEEALSCASQAAALAPDLPAAHVERAVSLASLGRFSEAQVAYARALALDPDDPDALLGAAHLYVHQLPSTRERDELGLLYAERGLSLAGELPELLAPFALLSAIALNDLGLSADALERARIALAREPENAEAAFQRAVALFELCRFEEARKAFLTLLEDPARKANAHHHLGLILEQEGRWRTAQAHFDLARSLSPEEFPSPQLLPEAEFRAEVARAVAALPADMRKDLAEIPVTAEEIPAREDLLAADPPLSPSILGLFRGPPLGAPCASDERPCRSVTLYRRNLARAVTSRAELLEQIRVTLLHEVGHLRGEDDGELAARGLE